MSDTEARLLFEMEPSAQAVPLSDEEMALLMTFRHHGPGPHPGTGTPQAVHGGLPRDLSKLDQIIHGLRQGLEKSGHATATIADIVAPARIRSSFWIAPNGDYIRMAASEEHSRVALEAFEWSDDLPQRLRDHVMERPSQLSRQMAAIAYFKNDLGFIRGIFSLGPYPRFAFEFGEVRPTRVQQSAIEDLFAAKPEAVVRWEQRGRPLPQDGRVPSLGYGEDKDSLRSHFGMVERHYGPGPHPGTGTDQDVHAGDGEHVEHGQFPGLDRVPPGLRDILADEEIERFHHAMVNFTDGPVLADHIFGFDEGWIGPDGSVYFNDGLTHDGVARRALVEAWKRDPSPENNTIESNLGSYPEWLANSLGWLRMSGSMDEAAISFHYRQVPTDDQINTMLKMTRLLSREKESLWLDFSWETVDVDYLPDGSLSVRTEIKTPNEASGHTAASFYDWLERVSPTKARVFRALFFRHYGPGAHPGTGTSQDVHAGDGAAKGDWPMDEISAFEAEILNDDHETLAVFSRDGREQLRVVGNKYGVPVKDRDQEWLRSFDERGIDLLFTHNHPNSDRSPLSVSDMMFAHNVLADEIVAVSDGLRSRIILSRAAQDDPRWWFAQGSTRPGAYEDFIELREDVHRRKLGDLPHDQRTDGNLTRIFNDSIRDAWREVARQYPEYMEYIEELL